MIILALGKGEGGLRVLQNSKRGNRAGTYSVAKNIWTLRGYSERLIAVIQSVI